MAGFYRPAARSVAPGGGAIDQTPAPAAADAAAEAGVPLFLPPASILRPSSLKSGTRIEGVPGETVLRYRDGGALIVLEGVDNVRLFGLVLDGDAKPLQERGSLLAATETKHLDVTSCRLIGSAANGISLRKVSGWIKDCEIGDIREAGLVSEDANGLEIAHNAVRDCGENGIVVSRSEPGEDMTIVTANRTRDRRDRRRRPERQWDQRPSRGSRSRSTATVSPIARSRPSAPTRHRIAR
jgi:uncharacterized secreted repeat protein (TIGR03808 family)